MSDGDMGWRSLGGSVAQPVVASNEDGRLEVFAIGADGALWHVWQTAPSSQDWSDWASFGGAFDPTGDVGLTRPAVGTNADGRLEVFLRSPDGRLWHTWQLAPNDEWSPLEPFPFAGGLQSAPAVVSNADGRLEVFMVGDLGGLWHVWQLAPNNGWSPLSSLLGPAGVGGLAAGPPAAGRNEDGRLEVFATTADDALWHIWQTSPNNGWGRWYVLGQDSYRVSYRPVVVNNADGRLELFGRARPDLGAQVWHIWQTAPNDGWSGPASYQPTDQYGSVFRAQRPPVAVTQNADGRLEAFATAGGHTLWQVWQTAPNDSWSNAVVRGHRITSPPTVGRNADGRLEVFAVREDGALWHVWQTAPNNGWAS